MVDPPGEEPAAQSPLHDQLQHVLRHAGRCDTSSFAHLHLSSGENRHANNPHNILIGNFLVHVIYPSQLAIKERKNTLNRQMSRWWYFGRFWVIFQAVLMILGIIFSADVLFVQMFLSTPDYWLNALDNSDDACLASYDTKEESAFQQFRQNTNDILWFVLGGLLITSFLHGIVVFNTRNEDNQKKLKLLAELSKNELTDQKVQELLRFLDHDQDGIVNDLEILMWVGSLPMEKRFETIDLLNSLKDDSADTFIVTSRHSLEIGKGASKTHGALIKKKKVMKKVLAKSSTVMDGFTMLRKKDIEDTLRSYAQSKKNNVLSLDEGEFLAELEETGTGGSLTSTQEKYARKIMVAYVNSELSTEGATKEALGGSYL